MRRLSLLLALTGLVACTTARPRPPESKPGEPLPELRLKPEALGATVSLTQRLVFAHEADPGGPRSLEALLEVDPALMQLAGFAMGQRILTLRWNGAALEEERDPRLPAQFQSGPVLRDVQLVYWPADAVRAALPAGWTLEDGPGQRTLSKDGREWVTVRYDGTPRWEGRTQLTNLSEHYQLTIDSRPADE
ncbi:DUF3261 domain-containing protein [Corallococcus sp. CA053C]|uniref:DUF3261 domain-containing protein n=1 Tax=Corallococcus sp. CA053C TaxID=2316732 RepID=UPI000EA1D62E|nr:DUF3261 domain-containing protein [Corallococcus sp. CA053C]RKH14866.1 DUF3261 domain-containing protein [Corallococcus sp. CA053C]